MIVHNASTRRFFDDKRVFLTDGGFETSMLFHEGFDLPGFSAAPLLDDPEARQAMARYFDRFLAMAAEAGTGFVLDTGTWRAGEHWAEVVGVTRADMRRLNREAAAFAKEVKSRWDGRVAPILIDGVIGPAGDGYAPEALLTPERAEAVHLPQVKALAEAGVDFIAAVTMTHTGEGIGIARAAKLVGIPVVVSYTVETDGHLPTGQNIAEAVAETDAATGGAPLYYMVNCAHPDHFSAELGQGDWLKRIGGLRANASRLSHAELDEATELDDGDPAEFGHLHEALIARLPALRVVGGCCGTDHRHVGAVGAKLHVHAA